MEVDRDRSEREEVRESASVKEQRYTIQVHSATLQTDSPKDAGQSQVPLQQERGSYTPEDREINNCLYLLKRAC